MFKILQISDNNKEEFRDRFINLYKFIFSQAPYYEDFQSSEINEIYDELTRQDGICILAIEGDKIIAFGGGVKLSKYSDNNLKELLETKFDLDKTFYNAELGVNPDYRNRGIAKKLVNERIELAKENGYNVVMMRTKKSDSMSIGIYQKLNFKILKDTIQIVNTKKVNNKIVNDERIFLYLNLK